MEHPFRLRCQPTAGLGRQAVRHVMFIPDLPRTSTDAALVPQDMTDDATCLLGIVGRALGLTNIVMIAMADGAMITVNAARPVEEDGHHLHLEMIRSFHLQVPRPYQKILVCPKVI